MDWAVGLGTTDACNLYCLHCYSRNSEPNYLPMADIKGLNNALNIHSINLGTGENGLNVSFPDIIEYLYENQIKTSLTSNGYTIRMLSEKQLPTLTI